MSDGRLDLSGSGARSDRAFTWLALGAAGMVLLILGLIAITMTNRAAPVFGKVGLDFFTTARWSPPDGKFGGLSFIWGTLYTSFIAIVLAVPISLSVALFITQLAPRWLKTPLVYLLDLLAVVPSVVFGLWGVLTLASPIQGVYSHIHHLVSGIPVLQTIFGDTPQGRSFMTAGMILAIMIIPIITSLSREVIETTPRTRRRPRSR